MMFKNCQEHNNLIWIKNTPLFKFAAENGNLKMTDIAAVKYLPDGFQYQIAQNTYFLDAGHLDAG